MNGGREALRTAPAGHPDRTGMMINLAMALLVRWEKSGSPADLDGAVEKASEALAAVPGEVAADLTADALHQATRQIRDQYRAIPSFWAGYLHAGA